MLGYALKQNQKRFIKTYKGKYFKNNGPFTKTRNKTIVFDLDETLGQFAELHIIYKCLVKVLNREITQSEFNMLFDLFPEFLRPGIITILEFLYHKKLNGAFSRLFLYTNNQCAGNWLKFIISYFHLKVGALDKPLFEEPICAFKIRNKIVNIRRTSNMKSYSDFIHCAMLPPITTEICFIDNTYYEHMCDDRVYYILPQSYYHSMKKIEIIRRLIKSTMALPPNIDYDEFEELLNKSLGENTYEPTPRETEMYITKKIMFHVREFLYFGSEQSEIVVYNIKSTGKTINKKRDIKGVRKTRKNMDLI
jgi:hypothetical protein